MLNVRRKYPIKIPEPNFTAGVLVVSGFKDQTRYIIEPTRFDLGLTRIEMVDNHLNNVARDSVDIDYLLDARWLFGENDDYEEL